MWNNEMASETMSQEPERVASSTTMNVPPRPPETLVPLTHPTVAVLRGKASKRNSVPAEKTTTQPVQRSSKELSSNSALASSSTHASNASLASSTATPAPDTDSPFEGASTISLTQKRPQVRARDLHQRLLQERADALRVASVTDLDDMIRRVKTDLQTTRSDFIDEEFAVLLCESRNRHLHVTNILAVEEEERIRCEKGWVSDLKEKERMGKRVAELDRKVNHCVLEMQKVASERQVKERDVFELKDRREKAMELVAGLLTMQKTLTDFKNQTHVEDKPIFFKNFSTEERGY
ncbi:hypothetical protein BC830DRAFT_1113667 [Chytriomyces sp. MP71]|nr:hypothetical protein BC830DRAFT_1113667 [Chytriomyces sp. MP71]